MADENKQGVETKPQGAPAGQQGVEQSGAPADPSAKIAELEAKLAKSNEERDNYREGMLRAKGKKPSASVDVSNPEALEEFVKNTVKDAHLEVKAEDDAEKQRKEYQRLQDENAELRRLAASGGSGVSAVGSAPVNDPKPRDAGAYWTDEQRNFLKQRGMTDEAIKVAEGRARNRDFYSEQGNFLGNTRNK